MRANLTIAVTGPDGEVFAIRRASNSVMQAGAQFIAQLFAGTGKGITHMGVGINDTPESDSFSTTALSNDAGSGNDPLTGAVEAVIAADAFQIELDETRRVVRVRVRGTMPADAAVGTVREAGLISHNGSKTVLYNRVLFPSQQGKRSRIDVVLGNQFPVWRFTGSVLGGVA